MQKYCRRSCRLCNKPKCRRGYILNRRKNRCVDINECRRGRGRLNRCARNSRCINTRGGYRCKCRRGYYGNARRRCRRRRRHPCRPSPCRKTRYTRCRAWRGRARCYCAKRGYRYSRRYGCRKVTRRCRDRYSRWCRKYSKRGWCKSKYARRRVKMMTLCRKSCKVCNKRRCRRGYILNIRKNRCVDINECRGGRWRIARCGRNTRCINRRGGYRCRCKRGYRGNPKRYCRRIRRNPCKPSPCKKNARCRRLRRGRYRCACAKRGYRYTRRRGCVKRTGQPCRNYKPNRWCNRLRRRGMCNSRFMRARVMMHRRCRRSCGLCSKKRCRRGYILNRRKSKCVDINECRGGVRRMARCGRNTRCINRRGGYRCRCKRGYRGNPKRYCRKIRRHPCRPSPCKKSRYTRCRAWRGRARCYCGKRGHRYSRRYGCRKVTRRCRDRYRRTCKIRSKRNWCKSKYARRRLFMMRHCRKSCRVCNKRRCRRGFILHPSRNICLDVNECSGGRWKIARCGRNTRCINKLGRYICKCSRGFRGNPKRSRGCRKIRKHPCQPNPCKKNYRCLTWRGKARCRCKRGYRNTKWGCRKLKSVTNKSGIDPSGEKNDKDYFAIKPVKYVKPRPRPLGIEQGMISNRQIRASCARRGNSAYLARPKSGRGWIACNRRKLNKWIQVDLKKPMNVHGVATWPHPNKKCRVLRYKVQYKLHPRQRYKTLTIKGKSLQRVFIGNAGKAKNGIKAHCFHKYYGKPIRARYVRIKVLKWKRCPGLQLELYGFRKPNDKDLLKVLKKDKNTRKLTGCQCYYNPKSFKCACCNPGACQCPNSNRHQCVQCGYGSRCGTPAVGKRKPDAWTKKKTGCKCPHNNKRNCACCEKMACQCGRRQPNQCVQCGHPEHCGKKPKVFGAPAVCVPKTCSRRSRIIRRGGRRTP